MRNIPCLLLIITSLCSATLRAQSDSSLVRKLSDDFCTEFSKTNFTKLKGSEMELGLLILPIIEKYSADIQMYWGLSSDNEEEFDKISEKIGQVAAIRCPKFLEFLKNNMDDIDSMEDVDVKSMSGVFQKIDNQQFTSIIIKNKAGKEERLWWFQYFDGADLLKQPASLGGKSITAKYVLLEVYDAKIQEYRTLKVLKGLEKN